MGAFIIGQNEGTSDRPHYVIDVCGWIRKGDKSDKRVIGLCWEVMFTGAVVAVARGVVIRFELFPNSITDDPSSVTNCRFSPTVINCEEFVLSNFKCSCFENLHYYHAI